MATYAEERLAAYRAQSKEIRRRSAQMEREVAKFLLGRRVPMSGAGSMKGDCEIETDKIGRIFIECKYTAGQHKIHGPIMLIDFKWFDKMHKDAISMKARFAALVFKYHGSRLSQYVILSTDVLTRYDTEDRLTGAIVINALKGSYNMIKSELDTALAAHEFRKDVVLFRCNRGEYAIMPITLFKEIIHDDTCSEE